MSVQMLGGPGESAHVAPEPRAGGAAARVADVALDWSLGVLAVWTVVYHVALLTGLGSDPSLVATVVITIGAAVWLGRGRRARTQQADVEGDAAASAGAVTSAAGPDRRWAWAVGVCAVVAAIGMAASLDWWLVAVAWLGAAVTGVCAAGPRRRGTAGVEDEPTPLPRPAPSGSRWDGWVVLAWCLGLGVLSLFVLRSNPDDLYYVNLSQWVAAHGSFPLHDTIFGNERWPMTSWPPIASYDALVGELARVFSVRAGTVVYEVVPPVATVAAVLALWRLLRAWRTPYVAWALSIALAFLLLDGASTYASPGNLFVTRMWQGKVVLLCVVVPLALTHLLRYVERPDRRGLGRLLVAGGAAVACSTTAMFLVPVIAVAGVAPLVRRPRAALAGFVALAAYPVAALVTTVVVGGRSADDFGKRALYRFDPSWIGHAVFLTLLPAFVVVLAVLLGPVLLPRAAARLTTAMVLLAVGVVFIPGVTQLAYDLTGLGPTLWRLTWGCTIAALVGVAAVRAWQLLRRRCSRAVTALLGVVACAAYAVAAPPTLAGATHTSLEPPLHWQRPDTSMGAVRWMLRHVPGQGVVLGPNTVSITVSVMTTRLKPVAPRAYFMANLAREPGFDFTQRLLLTRLANPAEDRPVPHRNPVVVRAALDALDVKAACLDKENTVGVDLIEQAGFRPGLRNGEYQCLVREGLD